MASAQELDSVLALLIARAPDLRRAGVLTLSLDGLAVSLAPDAPPVADVPREVVEEPADPLLDPATFGYRDAVPGFPRRRDEEADV